MTAAEIAAALGGRRAGGGWMARCPAHQDRVPSLSIRDGAHAPIVLFCHAGCPPDEVIAALRSRGLWHDGGHRRQDHPQRSPAAPRSSGTPDRTRAALAIWREARPATGTMVATYLASRGLRLSPPPALRFHPSLRHRSGGTWPCMVALVTDGGTGDALAISRTYLARDGRGKAPVEPQRMMLGPCRAGAVRLGPAGDALMIAEGVETALAAMQATGQPAWAALSTSGLRTLALPEEVREVIILADGDEPGEAAAQRAARRWRGDGRRVRIATPPRGMDFNDLLQQDAECLEPAS